MPTSKWSSGSIAVESLHPFLFQFALNNGPRFSRWYTYFDSAVDARKTDGWTLYGKENWGKKEDGGATNII